MVTHTSATAFEETPHASSTITISDALRRRAQSVITDLSIDPQWRSVIRYGLETNDPWLADLVRHADSGELIIDTIDFSQTPETIGDDSIEQKISALAGIVCQPDDKSAAALFVPMGTLENSNHPKVLANTAKHFAFARCADLNLYGIVDAQIDLVERELLTANGNRSRSQSISSQFLATARSETRGARGVTQILWRFSAETCGVPSGFPQVALWNYTFRGDNSYR